MQDSGSLSGYIRTYVFVRIEESAGLGTLSLELNRIELTMENEFLDKMEDNVAVRVWSERMQLEKGDSLIEGYTSEFCFTFEKVDLVLTVEEYTALLRCLRIQVDKGYSRAVSVPNFIKKLMNVTGMSEQWVATRIKEKGESKSLGHVDQVVTDLLDRLDKRVTPVQATLSETFRSLNAHFWKVDKVSYRVFFESYSPLKELAKTPRCDDITEERWITILQNLQDKDIEWKAPWMLPDEILYRCGDFNWVPLLGIWGAIGYAPLL
ncbi:hypothetical protein Goari_020419, partial [Gossypium aridum]|nr:hypothetical protein [Gossypium aridum]